MNGRTSEAPFYDLFLIPFPEISPHKRFILSLCIKEGIFFVLKKGLSDNVVRDKRQYYPIDGKELNQSVNHLIL